MTTETVSKLAGDTATGDFEPEQKRYLEGFVAGLQIAKTAKGLAGGGAPAPGAASRGLRRRRKKEAGFNRLPLIADGGSAIVASSRDIR